MEIADRVDSFTQDFLETETNVDRELSNFRDHGWVCDIKNFNIIFEEMAKVSNDLYQSGQVEIESLEENLVKLTNEVESKNLTTNQLEKEMVEMQEICERIKSEIRKQDEMKEDLKKQASNDYSGTHDNDRMFDFSSRSAKMLAKSVQGSLLHVTLMGVRYLLTYTLK